MEPHDLTERLRLWLSEFPVEFAALFGSATRKGSNGKDVDVLIVSSFFQDVPGHRRAKLLPNSSIPRLDLQLLTPIEFQARPHDVFVRAATSPEAIVLVER